VNRRFTDRARIALMGRHHEHPPGALWCVRAQDGRGATRSATGGGNEGCDDAQGVKGGHEGTEGRWA